MSNLGWGKEAVREGGGIPTVKPADEAAAVIVVVRIGHRSIEEAARHVRVSMRYAHKTAAGDILGDGAAGAHVYAAATINDVGSAEATRDKPAGIAHGGSEVARHMQVLNCRALREAEGGVTVLGGVVVDGKGVTVAVIGATEAAGRCSDHRACCDIGCLADELTCV